MKLVTNDYGCGTSSSIFDYGISDVVIVSENNFQHVFDVEDDLLFIGHDFLFYLWDNEEKLKRWIARKGKYEHWVWCFERVDAIVYPWFVKSHTSMSILNQFCDRILACDEDDCDKYKFDWLPQWASCKFNEKKDVIPSRSKVLFSGQAGKPEYRARNDLISGIVSDEFMSQVFDVTNTKRLLGWDEYVDNLLSYRGVLNPVGTLKALNTRAYEALYSGRVLLQQKFGKYRRHEEMLKGCGNVKFFEDFNDLKKAVSSGLAQYPAGDFYESHSLHARMKSIGLEIK